MTASSSARLASSPAAPTYRLLQWQYRAIYQAGEHAVRAWLRQGAPLDDPVAMFADRWLVDRPQLSLLAVLSHHRQELGRSESMRAAKQAAPANEILRLPGPLIQGQPSFVILAIERKRATASLRWNAVDLERDELLSLTFAQHLLEAGMPEAVQAWLEANASPARYQDQHFMSVRSGGTDGVAVDRINELVGLVAGFYRAALQDLSSTQGAKQLGTQAAHQRSQPGTLRNVV